jgi:hypothetical protein
MRSNGPRMPDEEGEAEERPPRLALLLLVLFPFLLVVGIALLYGWIRR